MLRHIKVCLICTTVPNMQDWFVISFYQRDKKQCPAGVWIKPLQSMWEHLWENKRPHEKPGFNLGYKKNLLAPNTCRWAQTEVIYVNRMQNLVLSQPLKTQWTYQFLYANHTNITRSHYSYHPRFTPTAMSFHTFPVIFIILVLLQNTNLTSHKWCLNWKCWISMLCSDCLFPWSQFTFSPLV